MMNRLTQMPAYQRAIAKAHLASSGINYDDMDKPIIAVANSWNDIVPGHVPLRGLAEDVKKGIREAGGLPLEFDTIAICDGITQAHSGMLYSLPSRDLIADSVECMVEGHNIFDGIVFLGACDKIIPAFLMAAARLNLPSLLLTSGPMRNYVSPAEHKQLRQNFLSGLINERQLVEETMKYYSEPGVCPFLGTANTMAIIAESLGFSLPDNALTPANTEERRNMAYLTGVRSVALVREGLTVDKIFTRQALENAIRVVMAIGGSLNSCLHLLALAQEQGINLSLADFANLSATTPVLVRVTPNDDQYTVNDFHQAGGVSAVLEVLGEKIHRDSPTVNGATLGEQLRPPRREDVIRPLTNPFAKEGGILVLHGNLAPEGALIKQSAIGDGKVFHGEAAVYASEEEAMRAVDDGTDLEGKVVVVYGEGPAGGPGMRELHRLTEIKKKFKHVAVVTDGRFSGKSDGWAVGYVSPEAAKGGPLGLVRNGDLVIIDLEKRNLHLEVSEEILVKRENVFQAKFQKSAFLRSYGRRVGGAMFGACVEGVD
ncbi:MAG: dihydroxy-acid dehydratase [Desulfitobacteriaceae bacterium]